MNKAQTLTYITFIYIVLSLNTIIMHTISTFLNGMECCCNWQFVSYCNTHSVNTDNKQCDTIDGGEGVVIPLHVEQSDLWCGHQQVIIIEIRFNQNVPAVNVISSFKISNKQINNDYQVFIFKYWYSRKTHKQILINIAKNQMSFILQDTPFFNCNK